MRWIERLLLKLLGLFAAAVAIAIGFSIATRPAFDVDDQDYPGLAAYFARAETLIESGDSSLVSPLDLDGLNGGDWTTACVFGGYTQPDMHMRQLGARVSPVDSIRWLRASLSHLRFFAVEEEEIAVAFIDREKRAHFLHFPKGIGSAGEHLQECVSRPGAKIDLLRRSYRPPTHATPCHGDGRCV